MSIEGKVKSTRCVLRCFLKITVEVVETTGSVRLFEKGRVARVKCFLRGDVCICCILHTVTDHHRPKHLAVEGPARLSLSHTYRMLIIANLSLLITYETYLSYRSEHLSPSPEYLVSSDHCGLPSFH